MADRMSDREVEAVAKMLVQRISPELTGPRQGRNKAWYMGLAEAAIAALDAVRSPQGERCPLCGAPEGQPCWDTNHPGYARAVPHLERFSSQAEDHQTMRASRDYWRNRAQVAEQTLHEREWDADIGPHESRPDDDNHIFTDETGADR
jgi:hypothetical protein